MSQVADQFNAEEVLTMAVRIERNGREFYAKAAKAVDDREASELLSHLSEWEKGHEALFESMRSELTEEEKSKTAIDPYCEEAMYLKAMADGHVFRKTADMKPADMVAGLSPEEMIDLAVRFEKDSLLFFLGLARLVSRRLGRDSVYKVIDEEIGHISYLEKQRARLRG